MPAVKKAINNFKPSVASDSRGEAVKSCVQLVDPQFSSLDEMLVKHVQWRMPSRDFEKHDKDFRMSLSFLKKVGMAFQEGKTSSAHHPGWCAALQVLWGE